jgi:hypothetical protein
MSDAETAFSTAFAKAGSCLGSETICEAIAKNCATAVRNALPDVGPSTCESARLRAAGKKAAGQIKCNAKAAAKDAAVDVDCIQKAEAKYQAAFARTSGCSGDENTVGLVVDEQCVSAVRGDSTGVCDSAFGAYAITGDTNGTPWRFRLEALDATCNVFDVLENSSPGIPATGDPALGALAFTAELQRLIQTAGSGFIAPDTGTNELEVLRPEAVELRLFGGSIGGPLLLADATGITINPTVTRTAGNSTCPVVRQCGDTYPSCDGTCPPGQQCVADTIDPPYGCLCVTPPAPCGATAPACNGACAAGFCTSFDGGATCVCYEVP